MKGKRMRPLTEFEIHAPSAQVGDLWESWVTIIHARCGAALGQGQWDMLDLQDAIDEAVNHRCPTEGEN